MAKKNTATSTKASPEKKPAVSASVAGSKEQAAAATTNELISKRAYEIWISKGRPAGRDLENWQQAERELKAAQKK